MKRVVFGALLLLTTSAMAQTSYSARPTRAAVSHLPVSAEAARVLSPGDELVQAVRQNWRGGTWRDTTRNRYTRYNAAGQVEERIIEDKDNAGAWQVRNRVTFSYNAQNQQVHDTLFSFLGNPLFAIRRTYNAAGKLDSMLTRTRFLGQWEDARRDVTSYDANGHITRLLQQDNLSFSGPPAWANYAQYLYTTDAQGRVTVEEYQAYNDQTSTWEPADRAEYAYLANDSTSSVEVSYWNPTTIAFELAGRDRFSYNAAGYRDTMFVEPYDAVTTTYGLENIRTYQYDARNNRTEMVTQVGPNLASLQNLSRTVYTYSLAVGRPDDLFANSSLTLAPNPSTTGTVELRYDLKAAAPVRVEILDLLGRRVAASLPANEQSVGAHTVGLDVRNLPVGLYLVRLTAAGVSRQVKLVVE